MRVNDVMTRPVAYCSPETNLAAAVEILWNRDCGILPIVDARERVVGVITDRDICVALGTQNRMPSQVSAREIASGKVFSCKPEEELRKALAMMAEAKVRRLLVVDSTGKPQGILSIDDVVLRAETAGVKRDGLAPAELVSALKSVYARQLRPESHRSVTAAD
jgi:CBS domain-containing protein